MSKEKEARVPLSELPAEVKPILGIRIVSQDSSVVYQLCDDLTALIEGRTEIQTYHKNEPKE